MRQTRMVRLAAGDIRRTLVVACLLGAVLVAGAWVWLSREHAPDRSDGQVAVGWQTIEYQDVKVDIPASWVPLDMSACEFQFEVWTAPGVESCDWAGGVAFYGSATFDPAQGPGVRRVESEDEPKWGGYTYAGDLVIYAGSDDREVVTRVLRSAS